MTVDKKRHRVMKDIAGAKPPCALSPDEWERSETANNILNRIIESPVPEKKRLGHRSRYLLLAGAALVLALVGVTAVFTLSGRGDERVASPSTSMVGTSIMPEGGSVTVQRALEDLVALSVLRPGSTQYQEPVAPEMGWEEALLKEAEALGLFGSSSGSGASLSLTAPVTRAQFALWLWRLFGPLPPRSESLAFSDLGFLHPDERDAVLGLAQAGVLTPYPDGTFRGHDALSREAEADLIARLEALLQ